MARYFTDDRTREQLSPEETTVLKLSGPLRSMTGRTELHLSKPSARELARWFGFGVIDPLEEPDPLKADATAADLPEAIRVRAIERGTPAGSRPPKARSRNQR